MQAPSLKVSTDWFKGGRAGPSLDADHPLSNHLLAALPLSETQPWLSQLELVDMPLGQVLYESGKAQPYVYFPTTAIVSWVYVLENGASTEIAMTGREGVVGMYMLMGGGSDAVASDFSH